MFGTGSYASTGYELTDETPEGMACMFAYILATELDGIVERQCEHSLYEYVDKVHTDFNVWINGYKDRLVGMPEPDSANASVYDILTHDTVLNPCKWLGTATLEEVRVRRYIQNQMLANPEETTYCDCLRKEWNLRLKVWRAAHLSDDPGRGATLDAVFSKLLSENEACVWASAEWWNKAEKSCE